MVANLPDDGGVAITHRTHRYWDEEEEDCLRYAVQKHGIGAWERMRHDPEFRVLKGRTGVQLKDKWRNLNKYHHLRPGEAESAQRAKGAGGGGETSQLSAASAAELEALLLSLKANGPQPKQPPLSGVKKRPQKTKPLNEAPSPAPTKTGRPRRRPRKPPARAPAPAASPRRSPMDDANLRYSKYVVFNNTMYISAQRTNDPMDQTVAGQTKQVLCQLDEILEQAGLTKKRLLRVTVFMTDMSDFMDMHAVWHDWVDPEHAPVRNTVEVRKLNKELFKIEMSAEAGMLS